MAKVASKDPWSIMLFVMVICFTASDMTPVINKTIFVATKRPKKIQEKMKDLNENNLKFASVKALFVVTGRSLTPSQTSLDIQVIGVVDMFEGLVLFVRIILSWWFVQDCSAQLPWF